MCTHMHHLTAATVAGLVRNGPNGARRALIASAERTVHDPLRWPPPT